MLLRRLFLSGIKPLCFVEGLVNQLDDLQVVGIDQAGTRIGLHGLCQRHQQLVRRRVPLDGAARLKRPWRQGLAVCDLSLH